MRSSLAQWLCADRTRAARYRGTVGGSCVLTLYQNNIELGSWYGRTPRAAWLASGL